MLWLMGDPEMVIVHHASATSALSRSKNGCCGLLLVLLACSAASLHVSKLHEAFLAMTLAAYHLICYGLCHTLVLPCNDKGPKWQTLVG
jgi:hypothetical protein